MVGEKRQVRALVIPGTPYEVGNRGMVQTLGRRGTNFMVYYDPTTGKVKELCAFAEYNFRNSPGAVQGIYAPQDMNMVVAAQHPVSREPVMVQFAYNPSSIDSKYIGKVYLDVLPTDGEKMRRFNQAG